jgi:hypothetical protein
MFDLTDISFQSRFEVHVTKGNSGQFKNCVMYGYLPRTRRQKLPFVFSTEEALKVSAMMFLLSIVEAFPLSILSSGFSEDIFDSQQPKNKVQNLVSFAWNVSAGTKR